MTVNRPSSLLAAAVLVLAGAGLIAQAPQAPAGPPRGSSGRSDGEQIRKAASLHRVSCVTTVAAALAAAQGLAETSSEPLTVRTLQEFHQR